MNSTLLKELGMDAAAQKLDTAIDLKKKLLIAYEHFKFVSPKIFDRFQKVLKAKSLRIEVHNQYQQTEYWRELEFVALKDYKEIPPPDCLMDLKKAQEFKIFDRYDVAKVVERSHYTDSTRVPDPIIFGCIDGCVDKFFITQWDDDVAIEDILGELDG